MQASRILIEGSSAMQESKVKRDMVDSLIDDQNSAVHPSQSRGKTPSARKNLPQGGARTLEHSDSEMRSGNASQASSLVDRIVAKAKSKSSENKSDAVQGDTEASDVSADDDSFNAA